MKLDMQHIDYNDKKSPGFSWNRPFRWCVPAGKCRNEELHEGTETTEPGRCDRGNFPVSSGADGFYSAVYPGKNRPDTIKYDCPQLEPILKPTYGCIVYQEQVMQIVRNLAGYTLGRSDLVRRAMSKKKAAVMEKEQPELCLWKRSGRRTRLYCQWNSGADGK